MTDDALAIALDELRSYGLTEDRVNHYRRALADFAGHGWDARHLRLVARAYARREHTRERR